MYKRAGVRGTLLRARLFAAYDCDSNDHDRIGTSSRMYERAVVLTVTVFCALLLIL